MTKQKKSRPVRLRDMSKIMRMRALASRFKRNNWWVKDKATLEHLAEAVRPKVGG